MADRSDSSRKTADPRRFVPYGLALLLLGCTVGVWWFWSSTAARKEQYRFDAQVSRITRAITDRLTSYTMLLRGGASLFVASEDVTREEWRDLYDYRQVRTDFPGILYMGYAPVIPRAQMAQHVRAVRESGFPYYSIRPASQSETCTVVLYLEPMDAGARRAMGFDLSSEAVRRAALEKARDSGSAVLSGKVELVSEEDPHAQSGSMLFVPVYARHKPVQTVEQRREALRGFVLSPFRIADLLASISRAETAGVDFRIYDGTAAGPGALMYAGDVERRSADPGHVPMFRKTSTLRLFDHDWTVEFQSTPPFDAAVDRWTSKGILLAGIMISVLTFLFVRSQELTQERATALAREMTSALRESERRLRGVTESAQDAILVVDHEAKFTYWNPAAERIFGYGKEEVLGRDAIDLIAGEEYRARLHEAFLEISRTGTGAMVGQTHEMTAVKKTGEEFPVETSVTAISVADHWHTVVVVRDLADRRRGEAERVAREAAEEASRAKSGFVANMSHEIRTPLNAILGFTQVLERDLTLTARQAEHVRTISRSGAHLLHLINDILDMSRIESGRVTVNKSAFCLHDLLDDLTLMFRSRADAKGLQVLADRDESVPRSVTADEGKLRQVFINLLGNSVKFTEEGGIAVRVRGERCPDRPDCVRLVAEVEDSGPGIPEADLERIFDPFGQADAGIKAGGTGLGLAISRRFVEMMGGTLTVTSQVGRGSCFRVDVPVEPAEDVAEREKPILRRVRGLAPGCGPFRILVVDDIQTNRALLTAMLEPLGFEVMEAGNGVEALEAYRQWSPHAVLMDMRMPVMDGYEATRRIRAGEEGRRTPIIAVTASAFDDLKEQVMAVGVDIYLRKPFRADELLDALEKCLGARYVYEDSSPPEASPEPKGRKGALPGDLVRAMRQAVSEGDMARLTELIDQVSDAEIARELHLLADRYEYRQLLESLEHLEGGA